MPRQRDSDLLHALGERLQRIRKERGWTQEKLAEVMEIEPVTLSRLETGQRALSLSALLKAADALEVSLSELLDAARPVPPPQRSPRDAELLRVWASLSPEQQDLGLRLLREVARG